MHTLVACGLCETHLSAGSLTATVTVTGTPQMPLRKPGRPKLSSHGFLAPRPRQGCWPPLSPSPLGKATWLAGWMLKTLRLLWGETREGLFSRPRLVLRPLFSWTL